MLIDWFTVAAQAVNFLILVWLMKRFLYQPILSAIAEREARIAADISMGEQKMAAALKLEQEFTQKNSEYDQQQFMRLEQAKAEVESERKVLSAEVHAAIESMQKDRMDSLKKEEESLHQQILLQAQQDVFSIARKILKDLSSVTLEEQICASFLERLGGLESSAKDIIDHALKSGAEPAIISTAFVLSPLLMDSIQQSLNIQFSRSINLRFEEKPELIGGIQFQVNGQKISWSLAEYLSSMQIDVENIHHE